MEYHFIFQASRVVFFSYLFVKIIIAYAFQLFVLLLSRSSRFFFEINGMRWDKEGYMGYLLTLMTRSHMPLLCSFTARAMLGVKLYKPSTGPENAAIYNNAELLYLLYTLYAVEPPLYREFSSKTS